MFARSFALSALLLGLAALAPNADAQRSVQVGVGVDLRGPGASLHLELGSRHGRFDRHHAPRYERREACPPVVPRRVWVPGRYETVERQVFVPGVVRQEWVPAVYETRIDLCGRPFQALVCAGHYRTVQDPGHYETRCERVWVDAHWETR
ncbi:MAG: hypothetical protein H6828_14840 [Planctomycetes bacterium]|nr:hypothetical protein [Planctomycetota bacterium]